MIPGSANPLLLATPATAGGLQIERSLRFNSSDSGYLSKAYGTSPTSGTTQTVALWVKRSVLGTLQEMFTGYNGSSPENTGIGFLATSDCLRFSFGGASPYYYLITTQVFRDTSAWYHITLSIDTTQATPSNRVKIYVNGIQVTSFSTADYPAQNATSQFALANSNNKIGTTWNHTASFFNGYLTNIHFIDGQALTPSSFTETDATTGQLIPKTYTGSYGTNGFNLLFADNSSNTASTLGKDTSGLGNNFTPNNLSVTAGAGNDSLVDSPTNYGTDTGVGGEVRGNYCTWNPLNSGGSGTPTLTNGNLDFSLAPSVGAIGTHSMGSIAVSTGKYYWEVNLTSNYSNAIYIGLMRGADYNTYHNTSSGGVLYWGYAGDKVIDGVFTSYGSTFTNNDVIGIALNLDAGTVTFYKNNSSQGAITLPASTSGWKPYVGNGSSGGTQAGVANFGQRSFAYTAPSGFKALNTQNLPAPLVTKSNEVFDVVTYTGDSVDNRAITGLAFNPDLVWFGPRSQSGQDKVLCDSVRGVQKALFSNQTYVEANPALYGSVGSFDASGFTIKKGTDTTFGFYHVNLNSSTYVAWAWDAGTSTVSNTQGSITSQVRANATAGFSVVTYTGTGANATVGHGLGVAPGMVIYKVRSGTTSNWIVYHRIIGGTGGIELNGTGAAFSDNSPFNGTNPTSTVLHVGTNYQTNGAYPIVAYAFAPVVGYSSFGSYTGNGSTDGPFVYTGFRPRWILYKRSDSGTGSGNWNLVDTSRSTYNVSQTEVIANNNIAEFTSSNANMDILSNGFKIRTTDASRNESAKTFIYAAFAEMPFNYSRAR